MVTWGRAFRAAVAYVAYVILWYIVGLIITFAGIAPMTTRGPVPPGPAEILFSIICLIIGIAIIVLGTTAAFFKILPEIVAEEVKK